VCSIVSKGSKIRAAIRSESVICNDFDIDIEMLLLAFFFLGIPSSRFLFEFGFFRRDKQTVTIKEGMTYEDVGEYPLV
jgi:hypothetical protein